MKRQIHAIAFAIFFLFLLPVGADAVQLLIPGGQVIGLQLQSGSVTVAAFDDSFGSCAADAGLKIGDELLSIDGHTISCADDVRTAVKKADSQITLTIHRRGKTHTLLLSPQQTETGPRLDICFF